jgi:hypothetical protein
MSMADMWRSRDKPIPLNFDAVVEGGKGTDQKRLVLEFKGTSELASSAAPHPTQTVD